MTVVGPFCVVAHALFAANAEVELIIGCLLDHLQLCHFSVVGFIFVPFFVSRDAVEFSPSAVPLLAKMPRQMLVLFEFCGSPYIICIIANVLMTRADEI